MARTIETEVMEVQETAQPQAVGKQDSSNKAGNINAPRGKRTRWILLFVFALAVAAATAWWLNARNYESTDDAEIEGHLDLVSPRISGTVSYINP